MAITETSPPAAFLQDRRGAPSPKPRLIRADQPRIAAESVRLLTAASIPRRRRMNETSAATELLSFEVLGAFRACVEQREPEAVALEVADGVLVLHALSVDAFDPGTGAAVMRQRSGEEPWGCVHLSIRREASSAFARSARSTTKGTHQIQPAPVLVTARQTPHADVTHGRRGLSVQRMDEAPAPCLRSQVPDAIANPPDPVPSKRLDIAKPRSAESGIGHHDGSEALGQDGLQSMQESPVGPGIVVA